MNEKNVVLKVTGSKESVDKFVETIEKIYPLSVKGPEIPNDNYEGIHRFLTVNISMKSNVCADCSQWIGRCLKNHKNRIATSEQCEDFTARS